MKISVIGTGNMGSALAEGLLKAGHQVTVWNRTAAKAAPLAAAGATVARSPADAISAADACILCLFDGTGTAGLLLSDDVRPALAGKPLINVAATLPGEIVDLAQAVARQGAVLAEVTPTVYPDEVRARQAHFLLGCAPEDRAFWTGILQDLGPRTHYAGPVGEASKGEMVLWLSYMFNTIAIALPVAAACKLGLPPEIVLSSLSENPTVRVAGAEHSIPQMIERRYSSSVWTVDNFATTMTMIMDFAASLKLPVAILEEIRGCYLKASEMGLGDKDVSAVFEALITPS